MSLLTTNMGLTSWTDENDAYTHTVLANNWAIIDQHNHRDTGVNIPLGGLASGAVDTAALASNAVTAAKLADGSVGFSKLDAKLQNSPPLGSGFWWWRPNSSTPFPSLTNSLYVPAIGQTLGAGSHDFAGGGSIVLPNMTQKVPIGAAADGSDIGVAGGSNSLNLSHYHVVNPHSHTVPGHSHIVDAHYHTPPPHNHSIPEDGDHTHDYIAYVANGGVAFDLTLYTRRNAFPASGFDVRDTDGNVHHNGSQSLFVGGVSGPGPEGPDQAIFLENEGAHAHTGFTGTWTPYPTDSKSPGTNSVPLTTDNSSGATTANALGGSTDVRQAFVTMYFIMKVKNSY